MLLCLWTTRARETYLPEPKKLLTEASAPPEDHVIEDLEEPASKEEEKGKLGKKGGITMLQVLKLRFIVCER